MLKPLAQRTLPPLSGAIQFIDGEAVEGRGDPMPVIFPATGETLVEVRGADADQIEAAIAAAKRTFDEGVWRGKKPSERARVLDAMAGYLLGRLEELAARVALDNGKTLPEGRNDVYAAAAAFQWAARSVLTADTPNPAPEGGTVKLILRDPVGVVTGIIPFNAPLVFAALKSAPALAAGNSVVLKPSRRAPLLPYVICEAAQAVGMPPGVINSVHGSSEAYSALCTDPRIDMITITAGTWAGTQVMQAAAPTIKNVLFELGGKSANIILDDADLSRAIPGAAAAIYRNAGQRCFSGSRLVVMESVADEVEQGVAQIAEGLRVGDPFEAETQVGAMIDQRAAEDVDKFVRRAEDDGLTVAAGGRAVEELAPGSFYRPTLLTGARSDSYAAQEEIFGPVLTVIRVRDVEDAIRAANDSVYGLAGGVWTRDVGKALHVAREVRTGYFWVNTYGAIHGDVPFGGYGQSGIGREAGRFGYEAYTELKTVMIDTTGGDSAPTF